MDPDDEDKLIPCDCDGLDYEIDYFELRDENTECKSEGQETTTVGKRHAH